MGLGQLGMSEEDLEFISPRAFYNKIWGFNQSRQAEFELIRLQTVELLNIQVERKHRIRDPRRLWKFPWEAHRAVDIERAKRQAKYFEAKIKRFEERGNK